MRDSLSCLKQKVRHVHELQLPTDEVQSHLTLYMSYIQRLSPVSTCPQYKSCDWRLGAASLCATGFKVKWPDKRKRRSKLKGQVQRGWRTTWEQRRNKSGSLCRVQDRLYCQGACRSAWVLLEKTFLVMGLESTRLRTWSCGQAGGDWRQYCGKSCTETSCVISELLHSHLVL